MILTRYKWVFGGPWGLKKIDERLIHHGSCWYVLNFAPRVPGVYGSLRKSDTWTPSIHPFFKIESDNET